jgi:hypothetical protein
MLRYLPGLIGAIAAMTAFQLLTRADFSVRVLVFIVVYLLATVCVDNAMARYGKHKA